MWFSVALELVRHVNWSDLHNLSCNTQVSYEDTLSSYHTMQSNAGHTELDV